VTDITLTRANPQDQAAGATTLGSFNLTAFYISEANRQKLENEGISEDASGQPGQPAAAGAPKAP
jgi:hypothetical protein